VTGGLQRSIGTTQFFTLSFGCIIGVGWVVALPAWLAQAGPGGAALAFVVGGLAMMLVGVCYAELATAFPVTGGEVAYAYALYGAGTSFVTGWFLSLSSIATTAFEAISLGWIAGAMLPGLDGPTLYTVAGEPVRLGSVAIGISGTAVLTWLNYRGAGAAARLQDILTWGLLAMSAWFIVAGMTAGSAEHLQPLFSSSSDRPIWRGVLTVMATAPFWYAGFDVIPQMMGERAHGASLRAVGAMILASIAVAGVFYVSVIIASSMTMPWREMVTLPLPAAEGFRRAFNSELLARVVLGAAALGLVTTWNSVFMFASRVLFTLGRARLVTPAMGEAHPRYGSPAASVLFVGFTSGAAVLLGRGALLPIVNVAGICLAGAALLICVGVIRFRHMAPDVARPYQVPGGPITAGLAAAVCLWMVAWALIEPAFAPGVPLEWLVLGGWAALGVVMWTVAGTARGSLTERERHSLVVGTVAKEHA
jgi:APA family basic amino acid/polyamine antiporter